MKHTKLLLAFAVLAAIGAMSTVSAMYSVNLTNVTWVSEVRYTIPSGSADDITIAGNITGLNIDASAVTDKWAGYYGNVSGSLTLRDAANVFFRWIGDFTEGVVCASQAASGISFTTLSNATGADIDTIWGFASDAPDSAVKTFVNTSTARINITGSEVNASVSAHTGPDQAADPFETLMVDDGANAAKTDFLFCVEVKPGSTNYKGGTSDYELIVPVDGAAKETYYFYAEVDG